jgi:hypothetical protein
MAHQLDAIKRIANDSLEFFMSLPVDAINKKRKIGQ